MSTSSALALRLCLGFAAAAMPAIAISTGSVPAQAADMSEKEAYDAAKSLGTVEAWDAFLSNYPSGFHAELARAYVKRLSATTPSPAPSPPAAPSVSASAEFPVAAGSWGGIVRDGPGPKHRKIASLAEGEPVTLMERVIVTEGDFPWFKIAFKNGKIGYQWGGILCAKGAERPDLYKTCP